MKKFILIMLMLGVLPAIAQEVYVVKNLNTILTSASQRTANATCFIYNNNHFKCACRFGDNSKLWVSKPIKTFDGELAAETKYGNIEACKK